MKFRSFPYFFAWIFLVNQLLSATDGTWMNAAGGNWSSAGNWVGGNIANTTPATATFPGLAVGVPVSVDNGIVGGPTINNLTFSTLAANSYIFSSTGGGKLNFVNNGGAIPTISDSGTTATQQFGTVGTPLDITITAPGAQSLTISPASNTNYTFVGTISGTGTVATSGGSNSSITFNETGTWSGSTSPSTGGTFLGGTNASVHYAKNGAFPTSTLNTQGVVVSGTCTLFMDTAMTSGNAFFLTTNGTSPIIHQSSGATVFINGLTDSVTQSTIVFDTMASGSLFQLQNTVINNTFNSLISGGVVSLNTTTTNSTTGSRFIILNTALSLNNLNPGGNTYVSRTFIQAGATVTDHVGTGLGASTSGGGSGVYVSAGGSMICPNGTVNNKDFYLNGNGALAAGALQGANASPSAAVVQGNVTLGWTDSGTGEMPTSVTINNSANQPLEITGTVAGTQPFTKTGVGVLQLFPAVGSNTFTATPTVSAGILEGNTAGFPTDIINNTTVIFTQTTLGTYSKVISGSGNVQKQGNARLIFSGANMYAGGTSVLAGILEGTTTSLFGLFALSSGTTLNFNQGVNGTFTGSLSGSGTLSIDSSAGAPVIQFSQDAPSFTGPVLINDNSVNNPTLQVTQVDTFAAASGLNIFAGGTFDLNNVNQHIKDLTGAGNITLGNMSALLTVSPISASTTFSGVISGTGTAGVAKGGGNILILSGTNTYQGPTSVNSGGGTLRMGTTNSIATSSSLHVDDNAIFDLNNFSQSIKDLTGTSLSSITLGSSAVLTVNPVSASTTFFGVISGSGTAGLTKAGTNTLILRGVNTYQGPTIINMTGGILRAGVPNTIATSSSLTVNSAGTFDLNNFSQSIKDLSGAGSITLGNTNAILTVNPVSASTTFSGVISGTGTAGVTKAGTNTLVLSGTNTYLGPTTINSSGGILRAGIVNTIATSSGLAVNSSGTFDLNSFAQSIQDLSGTGAITLGAATLTVNPVSASTTFSGGISGAGGVTKTGPNTLVMDGTNSYLGITTVSGGTLVGNTASIPGNALNNATLIFNQNVSATYAATLSGAGIFRKQGSAVLSFNSAQSQGNSFIDAGTLNLIASTFTTTALTVGSGTFLTGSGTIAGPTTVLGTVSPGNSIGIINGTSFSFGSGSTLSIQVDNTASSQVNATGSFAISPGATLQVVPISGGPFQTQYIIVTANPVSGTFSNVVVTSPIFNATVEYFTNSIVLILAGRTTPVFPINVVPGNGGQVLTALLGLNPFASACLTNFFESFNVTSVPIFTNQLNQLQPALFNAFPLSEESATIALREVISERLENARYNKCCDDLPFCSGVDVWVAPFGDFLHQGSINNVPGFSTETGGIAFGCDYQVNSAFLVGGSLAYSYSALQIGSDNPGGGKGHTNSGYAMFYSSVWQDDFYLDVSLLGGVSGFDGTRRIKFNSSIASVNTSPDHNNIGYEGAAHIGIGAPLGPVGCLNDAWFTPYALADYIFIHETSYKEHGGDCLNLDVNSKNSDLLRAEEGFLLSSCKIYSNITVVPEVRVAVAEEWRFQGKNTTSHFDVGDISFKVKGIFPRRVLFVPGIGVTTYFFCNQSILSVKVDGEFARHYRDVKAQIEYSHRF